MKKLPTRTESSLTLFIQLMNTDDLDALSPGQHLILKERLHELYGPAPQLLSVHKEVRQFFMHLLGREGVRKEFPLPLYCWVENGKFQWGLSIKNPQEQFWGDLYRILHLDPVRIKRCPQCKTFFSMESERQQFCSNQCRLQARGDKLKEERREYMRDFMAKRRKTTKKGSRARQGRKEQ